MLSDFDCACIIGNGKQPESLTTTTTTTTTTRGEITVSATTVHYPI